MKKNDSSKTRQEKGAQTPKKPYEPPRVVSHNALEVIAGSCTPNPPGKVGPQDSGCSIASS